MSLINSYPAKQKYALSHFSYRSLQSEKVLFSDFKKINMLRPLRILIRIFHYYWAVICEEKNKQNVFMLFAPLYAGFVNFVFVTHMYTLKNQFIKETCQLQDFPSYWCFIYI